MTLQRTGPDQETPDRPSPERTPRRRPRWYLEALVVVWLTWAYDAISNLPAVREHEAMSHGEAVLHIERALHIDPELAMNHWLYHHPLIGLWAGDYYDNAHFIVTFAVVGWLYWRHPDAYRPLRNGLVLINVIGFAVFWLWPMAPLRLLPHSGAYDIVAITHAYGGWHSGPLAHVANEFASMPSLHLGWAMWAAFAVWYVMRPRWGRWAHAIWLYPALTFVDVLATANHFVLDCLAGIATMAVATAAGFWLERRLGARHRPGTGATPAAGKAAHARQATG